MEMLLLLVIITTFLVNNASGQDLDRSLTSYLGICAVIASEIDVVEWIDYHYQLNNQKDVKFYLYQYENYGVAPNLLSNYQKEGNMIVEIETVNNRMGQAEIFQKCLEAHRPYHQFIAFLTTDEYIVTNNYCSMKTILSSFEEYGGLVVNWMLFGSSNHESRPTGGILPNYYKCKTYDHFRTIVNTNDVLSSSGNPHQFLFEKDKFAVDSNFIKVTAARNFPRQSLYDVIYINNYHLKSRQDFDRVFSRPVIFNYIGNSPAYFKHINNYCEDSCPILQMPQVATNRMNESMCLEMSRKRAYLARISDIPLFPSLRPEKV